eukprot:scaffold33389_cov91-Cyclotella_meneghiniana.AAC.5
MIEYSKGNFGLRLLFRWNGSALIKASIPGLFSVALFLCLYYEYFNDANTTATEEDIEELIIEYLDHPYAIGVLIASVSLLITFRANYGYQRYWEGCTAVHNMMSKFMDATMHSAVFHLQSDKLVAMRPPSFYDWDELNGGMLTRDREGYSEHEEEPSTNEAAAVNERQKEHENRRRRRFKYLRMKSGNLPQSCPEDTQSLRNRKVQKSINETKSTRDFLQTSINGAETQGSMMHGSNQLLGPPRLDGGWGMIYPDERTGRPTATYYNIDKYPKATQFDEGSTEGFASRNGGRTPSLFLQELAHLSSLLCAVAMTTLRNDLDDVESPLGTYTPGQRWPECDPLKLPKEVKFAAYGERRIRRNLRYVLGMDQTRKARTTYNAARPMLVLGGVSDNEIAFLQRARGPYAKTQLCWSWLSEFAIREHLAGSMGDVGPPIVSRVVQFLSDGMKHYNEARKIMWIPFPFVHAQLSAFFIAAVTGCVPFLMKQYANQAWLGCILCYLVVTCLAGIHEVARELENPFRNAPNDIPLCTMMAMYNEALITMYAGFHPDSYWNEADVLASQGVVGESNDMSVKESQDNDSPRVISDSDTPRTESDMSDTPRSMNGIDEKKDDIFAPNDNTLQKDLEHETMAALRGMIELQATKIKDLQDRMKKKEDS